MEFLVELNMRESELEKLWEGTKPLPNLKWMNLSKSSQLKELPDLSTATKLQKLHLENCCSLANLPSSIGYANNLLELNLSDCSSLVKLPSSIGNATNLRKLMLPGCSSLLQLPSSIGNANNFSELNLSECSSLLEVPTSIGNLVNLWYLGFEGCSSLLEVPVSIGNLTNLQDLDFDGCSSLVELPVSIGNLVNLKTLSVKGCSSLLEVPVSIGNLTNLQMLYFDGCSSLVELPASIGNLHNLRNLTIKGCKQLLSRSQLPDFLLELEAENCESLERLDCSFPNPDISLNFANSFKLNKEARDLIIQTSTKVTVLPGGDMPTNFTYRANGGSLEMKLNERQIRSTLIFKVCIMLASKKNDDVEAGNGEKVSVHYKIMDKQYEFEVLPLTEHLYIFEKQLDVTSNEVFFGFVIRSDEWVIKECGVHLAINESDSAETKKMKMEARKRMMEMMEMMEMMMVKKRKKEEDSEDDKEEEEDSDD